MADTAENQAADTAEGAEPIVKTRSVPLGVDGAFSLFTDEMTSWWPFASHSLAGNDVDRVAFDLEAGQLVEHTIDGTTHTWAEIEAWDPPHRLALAWHPGRDADAATSLEVRFEPDGDGTRVVLTHAGWDRFGREGAALRANYDTGWDHVLAPYVSLAG